MRSMRIISVVLAGVALVAVSGVSLLAHHAFGAELDRKSVV